MKLQKQVRQLVIDTILGKHQVVVHGDLQEFDLKLGGQGIEMITYPGTKRVWGVSDKEIEVAEEYIFNVLNESEGDNYTVIELHTEESWLAACESKSIKIIKKHINDRN